MAATSTLTMAATTTTSPLQIAQVSSLQGGATRTRLTGGITLRRSLMVWAAPKGSSGPAINAPGDKVTEKMEDAQEICAGDTQSDDCVTAWSEVEAEKAKKKDKTSDPLEEFCEDNPEADECRTYTD